MDAVTQVPAPVNEPVLDYAPGSSERAALEIALAELGSERVDLPHTIAGKRVMGTGKKIDVRQPHATDSVGRSCCVCPASASVRRHRDCAGCASCADRGRQHDHRSPESSPHCRTSFLAVPPRRSVGGSTPRVRYAADDSCRIAPRCGSARQRARRGGGPARVAVRGSPAASPAAGTPVPAQTERPNY